MADAPLVRLRFEGDCPDCALREVLLPAPLPEVGDDFDWGARDYDGFRMFMLEELASRFPERRRWTPADTEVALVEAMAAILDQLSDMLDRVSAEAFLESARRPETVRQLLQFIGYDALAAARGKDHIDAALRGDAALDALHGYWRSHPHAMEQARRAGPREIHTQKRMVTPADYALRLREHPLVENAHAWLEWHGSWHSLQLAVIGAGNRVLDRQSGTPHYDSELQARVINFHETLGVDAPRFDLAELPTLRMILRPYVDAFRMVGQEVILRDPVYVGIYLSISVRVGPHHFQSEIRHAIAEALGHGPQGFFAPGNHGFGEDLYLSDVIEALMHLDGIEQVCLNRFKRVGDRYLDRVKAGFIALHGLEVARCDNDASRRKHGYYRLKLHGGRRG